MDEPDLFSAPPAVVVVRARATDPETSHEAAEEFERDQSRAQLSVAAVVLILKDHGPLTDFQIREAWPKVWGSKAWSYTLPCKARHWARLAGLVKHDGFGTHGKRKVRRWALGRDEVFLGAQEKCPHCGQRVRAA